MLGEDMRWITERGSPNFTTFLTPFLLSLKGFATWPLLITEQPSPLLSLRQMIVPSLYGDMENARVFRQCQGFTEQSGDVSVSLRWQTQALCDPPQ